MFDLYIFITDDSSVMKKLEYYNSVPSNNYLKWVVAFSSINYNIPFKL